MMPQQQGSIWTDSPLETQTIASFMLLHNTFTLILMKFYSGVLVN